MIFNLADICDQISPHALDEGWLWLKEGRVMAPNVQRDGAIVSAVITQSGGRPFRVYARNVTERGATTIHGECSCAVGRNCEHVAAMLLQALKDRGGLLDPAEATNQVTASRAVAAQEQTALPETAAPALQPRGPGERQLVYRLSIRENFSLVSSVNTGAASLSIATFVARATERGGVSLGQPFAVGKMVRSTPPRFLQSADLELLAGLALMPGDDDGSVTLKGSDSGQLLRALLATQRCHLRGPRDQLILLRQGEARKIRLAWHCNEAAQQAVAGRTEPRSTTLLRSPGNWYLDSATGECGPVFGDVPGEAINHLLTMAPVDPLEAGAVADSLAHTYADVAVPLPQVFEVISLSPARPVPCLCLTTEKRGSLELPDADEFVEFARLHFEYFLDAPHERSGRDRAAAAANLAIKFDPGGVNTRLIDGRVVQVLRDAEAEQAAVQQLIEMGLEPNDAALWHHTGARFVPEHNKAGTDSLAWLHFQTHQLPLLRAQGWRIGNENFRYWLVEASEWTCDVASRAGNDSKDWFSIGMGVLVDGERVDLLPILLRALRELPHSELEHGNIVSLRPGAESDLEIAANHLIIPLVDQEQPRLLSLPMDRLLPILQTLLDIYGGAVPDLLDTDRLQMSRTELANLTTLHTGDANGAAAPFLHWTADVAADRFMERLRNVDSIPGISPPEGLLAELRPYQREGLNWLQFLREFGLAGVLADDMGLGKTLQALAHVLVEHASSRSSGPSLVIAPTSLMFNWRREAERFAPGLKVLVLHGPQRKSLFAAIADHDLVITTYPLVVRDRSVLLAHQFHLLILDEAQVIKNSKSQASRAVRELNARHRVWLTGTPMENHLGELWSLFDVLLPGFLGDHKQFSRVFRTPIEKHGNQAAAERLRRRIRPYLLRRTKQQVAAELPDKTEMIQSVTFDEAQRELYETVRLAMHSRVKGEIERQGLARSQIVVLDALLKLRQVCCDPRLVNSPAAREVNASAKLDTLMQLLPSMIEDGRRVLLFSQFTSMLSLIEERINQADITYVKLTGRTRDRETPVQRFQAGEVPLFLVSLKAGGVGLNLTAADTVIHYDPWWNPAVERQATDRAHRIGQRQAVFVYKLICAGTVEEKIQAMQQRKQALADGLYQTNGQQSPQWNSDDLDELFAPLSGPLSPALASRKEIAGTATGTRPARAEDKRPQGPKP